MPRSAENRTSVGPLYLSVVTACALLLPGCGAGHGNGLWSLTVGGRAKLVSPDGSEIVLERLAGSPAKKGRRGRGVPPQADRKVVEPGTSVVILAIDGDDARVRIAEGPDAGSIYWTGCDRLEAESNPR